MIFQYSTNVFTNGLNIDKLNDTLINNITLGPFLDNIAKYDDITIVSFKRELTDAEAIILNQIINTHDGKELPYVSSNIICPYIFSNKITNKVATVISSYIFDGSVFKKMLLIKMLIEYSTVGTYTIIIYDNTNKTTLKTITGTNKTKYILNLDSFDNIPSNDSIIDILVKVSTGTLTIYHINVYIE